MKRIKRQPRKFDVLDLFARLSREEDLNLGMSSVSADFSQLIGKALEEIRNNPIAIHGRRIQEMFAYVAASLGKAVLVKGEDAGDIISTDPELAVPDFRVVLNDKTHLLVEVKNHHSDNPAEAVRLSSEYVSRLARYGSLMAARVFVAVYWSRWNQWTLTPLDELPTEGLTLLSAALGNHMYLLGDQLIGTTPPLTMRIVADPAASRKRDSKGICNIRIGALEYLCAGTPVTESKEKTLAFQLIVLGNWPKTDSDVQLSGDDVEYFDLIFAPEEAAPNQNFQIIGVLSSMISRRFQLITTDERVVTSLSPGAEPGSLAVPISEEYRGTALPLWRFVVSPKK
jgi:hypothetical protein